MKCLNQTNNIQAFSFPPPVNSQVWFQNARAKWRRSLATSDSPSVPVRGITVATSQSQLFPSSTIDQLQLSLLTSPLADPPTRPGSFLDHTSQGAPGPQPFQREDVSGNTVQLNRHAHSRALTPTKSNVSRYEH